MYKPLKTRNKSLQQPGPGPRNNGELPYEQIREDMLAYAKKHPQLGALHTLDPEQARRQHQERKKADLAMAKGDMKTPGEVADDMRNLEKKSVSYANLSNSRKRVIQDRTEHKALVARTESRKETLFFFVSLPFLAYLLSMYIRYYLEPAAARLPESVAAPVFSFCTTYVAGPLSFLSWTWEWDSTRLFGPDLLFIIMCLSAIGFGPFRRWEFMDKIVAVGILGMLINPLTTAVMTGVMSPGFSPQVAFVLKYPLVILVLVAAAKTSGLAVGPLVKFALNSNRKEATSKN